MAIYKIVVVGEPVLRQEAKKIKEITPQVEKLLNNLRDTLQASETGVGLAAPQIGISKCAIVIDFEGESYALLNPEIVEAQGAIWETEGCLSVPGVMGEVRRAKRLVVQAWDQTGKEVTIEAEGLLARIFQHEIDHLHGILFIDRAENLKVVQ